MKLKTRLVKKRSYSLQEETRLFRLFASWSKARKLEYLKKCPALQALKIKETWAAWARDNQLAPTGTWSTWVVKAGRGWGKTRTGAEWIIEQAYRYPGCHIALVGRTVADVRKVMIEGISGILSVSPHDFKPVYQPTNRQLMWPNGSHATTYSADEPDQLRGPQHSFAWADERCFIKGTLIRTSKGLCPIEKIQPGDLVYTRKGLKRVKHAGLTNPSTTVYDLTTSDGRVLTGTGNHPIWVQDKGFKPLYSLSYGDILMVWEQKNQLKTVSSGMAVGGGSTKDIIATDEGNCCTELSMHPSMARFLKAWTSITKTRTKPTMTSRILRCLPARNIRNDIDRVDGPFGITKKGSRQRGNNGQIESHTWQHVLTAEKSSQQRLQLLSSATPIVERLIEEKTHSKSSHSHVNTVVSPFWSTKRGCNIAHTNALTARNVAQNNACSVEQTSGQQTREQSTAQKNVDTKHAVRVKSVRKRKEHMAVFNLEVEDCHEYFANDILVHNCAWQYDDAWDQLSFGLRIVPAPGVDPQCVVTTTPRNTKAMKALLADPTTVVTNGKTYDNQENLSARFIREMERRYAGTRLGLQEIDGLVIDDIDGALWKRAWIDDGRVVATPALKRVVVAVDPPASSPESSEGPAECGIIVAGLGVDGHGYVLADYSLAGTPDEWADEVLAAYSKFRADLIVGEVNNGGEMVGHTIKTAAKLAGIKNIPYEAIHASRGKQTRAEPVSTLYKNQHVHHVGVLADLEFQQCNWIPGEKSPDRLDAAVWAITKLMIEDEKSAEKRLDDMKQYLELLKNKDKKG